MRGRAVCVGGVERIRLEAVAVVVGRGGGGAGGAEGGLRDDGNVGVADRAPVVGGGVGAGGSRGVSGSRGGEARSKAVMAVMETAMSKGMPTSPSQPLQSVAAGTKGRVRRGAPGTAVAKSGAVEAVGREGEGGR